MSEFDAGSGRKRFVRDVMRRITPNGPEEDEVPEGDPERGPARSYQDDVEDLQDSMRLFGPESPEFRRQLDRLLAEFETLRRRYQLTREQSADAERQNERLVNALHEAKQQIELLKEEVDKLCAPPNNYGIFNRANKDGTAEIVIDGRAVLDQSNGSATVLERMLFVWIEAVVGRTLHHETRHRLGFLDIDRCQGSRGIRWRHRCRLCACGLPS